MAADFVVRNVIETIQAKERAKAILDTRLPRMIDLINKPNTEPYCTSRSLLGGTLLGLSSEGLLSLQ